LLAIARSGPVGIDVERVDQKFDWTGPAQIAFHHDERRFVEQAHTARRARFYRLWTRKEALFKALGKGVHDDMGSVSVVYPNGMPRAVVRLDDGSVWQIKALSRSPRQPAALATSFAVTRLHRFGAERQAGTFAFPFYPRPPTDLGRF
jgi:4'-phosphopantetheinyl transferase